MPHAQIRFSRARMLPRVALAAAVLLTACHSERARRREQQRAMTMAPRDSLTLGPGDIRIVNADSSVELALVGDKVESGLSDKTLKEVATKTDTSEDSGSGLGASIARTVKSAVRGALSRRVTYPVSDIQDVRYEDGRLKFIWKDGKPMTLIENANVNGKKVLNSFRPADAQAFVTAFRARKAQVTTQRTPQ